MAIPNYSGTSLSTQEQGEYLDYIDELVGVVARNRVSVQYFLYELKGIFGSYNAYYPNLVDEYGLINLNALPDAFRTTYPEVFSSGIKIYGTPLATPVFYGYVDKDRVLAFGSHAIPYLYGAGYTNPNPSPFLLMVDSGPYVFPDAEGLCPGAETGQTTTTQVSFVATYITKNGEESAPSNIITLGPFCTWTTVTLGVEEASVPADASSVRYYRFFPVSYASPTSTYEDLWLALSDRSTGVFRLVSEVKNNGS